MRSVFRSRVTSHPLVTLGLKRIGYEAYNLTMRYYTIKIANDRTTFKCCACPHSVVTTDFDMTGGTLRTQAAKAMNEHAAAKHRAGSQGIGGPHRWSLKINTHFQDASRSMAQIHQTESFV